MSLETPFNYEKISDPTLPVRGFKFERDIWVKLNRIRTEQHGRCFDYLFKWNLMISSPICDSGLGYQTMAHIVCSCSLRRFKGDYMESCKVYSQRAVDWLKCLDLRL